MSEKVVITQGQAEALEFYKTHASKSWIVEHHIKKGWTDEIKKGLQNMLLNNLIKALYIGYEVEPEFKVGDWLVFNRELYKELIIGKINEDMVVEWSDGVMNNLDEIKRIYKEGDLRHATPSEIAKEKERRINKKLDDVLSRLTKEEIRQLINKLDYEYEVNGRIADRLDVRNK